MKGNSLINTTRNLSEKTIACVLVILTANLGLAQTATSTSTASTIPSITGLNTSFNLGPVAVSLQQTNPIQAQTGGVWDTLHIETRDDTQTPPFHATLDAVGQAADVATLLGGFLPCVVIIEDDLAGSLTLAQAEADCYAKTKVTVTSFHDDLIEYALVVALIAFAATVGMKEASPILGPQMSAILGHMQTSLAGVGGTQLSNLVSDLQTSLTVIEGGSIIP